METVSSFRRSTVRLVVLLVLLVAVCGGVSVLVSRWMMRPVNWEHDMTRGHQWLHKELNLTPEEAARVDAFEADYRKQRAELLVEIKQRIARLAELLRSSNEYTDEVNQAVHQLHVTHGKLQTLSIEHYYQMLSVLPPGKQDKLRKLAIEALSEPE